MRTFVYPNVEQTLAVLRSQVDGGRALYPSSVPRQLLIPLRPTGVLHDKRTGELLDEPVVPATDDPQHAVFKATYDKPFTSMRADPGYERGALGVSISWKDLDPAHPEFHGFEYGATDAVKALVAERTRTGEVSWVGYFPQEGLEQREGVPDLVSRKAVEPLGWIAVTGDHFTNDVGSYVPFDPRPYQS